MSNSRDRCYVSNQRIRNPQLCFFFLSHHSFPIFRWRRPCWAWCSSIRDCRGETWIEWGGWSIDWFIILTFIFHSVWLFCIFLCFAGSRPASWNFPARTTPRWFAFSCSRGRISWRTRWVNRDIWVFFYRSGSEQFLQHPLLVDGWRYNP